MHLVGADAVFAPTIPPQRFNRPQGLNAPQWNSTSPPKKTCSESSKRWTPT